MNTLKSVIGLLCIICTFSAHADDLLKKTVDIYDIDSIELQGPGLLTLSQDGKEHLEITASRRVMERIDVSARGSTLRLRFKQSSGWRLFNFDNSIHYKVSVKNLNKISTAGSGNIEVVTDIKTESFLVGRSGSGNIKFKNIFAENLKIASSGSGNVDGRTLEATRVELKTSGSGNMSIDSINAKGSVELATSGSGNISIAKLTSKDLKAQSSGSGNISIDLGQVEYQKIGIAGSGDYIASKLKSKNAEIDLSGSTDAEIWVTESLEVDASGASDVEYYGEPKSINTDTSGASKVKSMGKSPH